MAPRPKNRTPTVAVESPRPILPNAYQPMQPAQHHHEESNSSISQILNSVLNDSHCPTQVRAFLNSNRKPHLKIPIFVLETIEDEIKLEIKLEEHDIDQQMALLLNENSIDYERITGFSELISEDTNDEL